MTDSTCQSNPASQPRESTEVHTDNNVTESSLHKVTDHKPSHSQVDRPLSVTTDNAENNHCVLDMTELPNNGNNNASAAATPVSANDSAILSDLSQVSEGKDNESESSLSSSTSLKRSDSGIHIETPHNADVENPQSAAASASAPAVAMVTDQSSPPSNEDMDADKFDMQGNLCSSTPDDWGMRKLSSPTNDDQSASAMDDKESTGNNNMQAQATEDVACHVTSENPEKEDNDEIDAEKTDTDSHSLHEIGDSDLSDAELGGVETVEEVRRRDTRRKRHRRLMSSSSDSSDRDIENGVEGEAANQSDEEEEDMDVDYTIPKDPWQAYLELRKREYGLSNHIYAAHQFRTNTSGSTRLVQRLKMQYRMERHEGCVNALNFNKEGTLLASGSDDLKIVVWDWARNQEAFVFESGHRANVFQSKFLPYGGDCHIISCARDGQVRLAELSSTGVCKGTKKLAQHKGSAHKLALLNDTPHVFLSCGEDAVTFEIDVRQEKPNKLSVVKEGDKKIALYSIHANPSRSHEFCLGGRDHFVRIYDRRMLSEKDDAAPMLKYCPHHLLDSDVKANVTCAVYNYDGSEVLGTYNDEDIYLFDTSHSDGADSIKRFTGHRNNATVKGVNFYGPKSEFIVSGSDCSNIFFWEKQSEKIVQYVHGDDGGVVNVLEPHPLAPILATSGLDHDVKIWAPTSEEATNLKGLCKVMKRNKKERDDDRMQEPDMIDGQMLWMLMHHLRRTQRRRARQEGEQMSSSSESSNTDSDSDDDAPEPMQCAPS